jgi:hypothetical protein
MKRCSICDGRVSKAEHGKLSLEYTKLSASKKPRKCGTWAENICVACCKKIHNYVRLISKERE